MGMKVQKNNKGFTLVEVICAVTIMMLVVVPIFTGFFMAAKTNAAIGDKLEISMMLENELESIKATGKMSGYQRNSIVYDLELTKSGIKQETDKEINTYFPDTLGENETYECFCEEKNIYASISMSIYNSNVAYYTIILIYDPNSENPDDNVILESGVYAPW